MLTDNAFTDPLGGLVARLELLRGTVSIGATTMPLTPRERVLVAALVRCGHPIQRVDLLALLWPDHEGARSANMLDISMHRLRKRLGFDVVVQIRGAYAISERAIVDVREIEHLAERILAERPGPSAIERYERVYADVACGCLSLGTDFEWLQRMERRFKNLTQAAATRCAVAALLCGMPQTALRLARTVLVADPCDEEARESTIRALLALDDRAGAIREFRDYTQALREELDLSPSRSLLELIELQPCG